MVMNVPQERKGLAGPFALLVFGAVLYVLGSTIVGPMAGIVEGLSLAEIGVGLSVAGGLAMLLGVLWGFWRSTKQ